MDREPIFRDVELGQPEREALDRDGHVAFPGLLAESARSRLARSLSYIDSIAKDGSPGHEPSRFAAEYDWYLESLIGHPQLLGMARAILGEEIRYDHCVTLNRAGGNRGISWHTHDYSAQDPTLGFIRIFFYVTGFAPDDGGLKVVPGSHLFREQLRGLNDRELCTGWLDGRRHPMTGKPLRIRQLAVPPGTVIVMWTYALHAVTPRRPGSGVRQCVVVVYAYRNPGQPSRARWISADYERRRIRGAEGLLSLY